MQSIAISVSVCLSVRSHISKIACPNFTKFSAHVAWLPMTVARSPCNGSMVRYVLPVLWMMSAAEAVA